jgi:hypothetical protein
VLEDDTDAGDTYVSESEVRFILAALSLTDFGFEKRGTFDFAGRLQAKWAASVSFGLTMTRS